MQLHNVGTAPGTTVLRIPGRRAAPGLSGALGALGTVYPTDFDRSKYKGYLPYWTGWVPGVLRGPDDQAEAAADIPAQAQIEQMKLAVAKLELDERAEALKTQKSQRIWAAVTGIVSVAGLAVSIYALKKRR